MVAEVVGFKTGLALTFQRLRKLATPATESKRVFQGDKRELLRVRSEEFQEITNHILFGLGNTSTPERQYPAGTIHRRYKRDPDELRVALAVTEEWGAWIGPAVKATSASGKRSLDPTPFLEQARGRHGLFGAKVALELFDTLNTMLVQNPWAKVRRQEWKDTAELDSLFRSESLNTLHGRYFDQRFIDYIARNFEEIDRINWRKFEGLVGEYFVREGFQVEMGPGRNDDGVDARIWPAEQDKERPPAILVQAKRQKESISKLIVKGLYADVINEGATSGLIVTTSVLSPGAEKVRVARSYPINTADRGTLTKWIKGMRSAGSGALFGD